MSSELSDESTDQQLGLNFDNIKNNTKNKEKETLQQAAMSVENDLSDLAAIIEQASQISTEKYENQQKNDEYIIIDSQSQHSVEEDDDTSKQVTQDYGLNDNGTEVRITV